jgi:hypothetical protein
MFLLLFKIIFPNLHIIVLMYVTYLKSFKITFYFIFVFSFWMSFLLLLLQNNKLSGLEQKMFIWKFWGQKSEMVHWLKWVHLQGCLLSLGGDPLPCLFWPTEGACISGLLASSSTFSTSSVLSSCLSSWPQPWQVYLPLYDLCDPTKDHPDHLPSLT